MAVGIKKCKLATIIIIIAIMMIGCVSKNIKQDWDLFLFEYLSCTSFVDEITNDNVMDVLKQIDQAKLEESYKVMSTIINRMEMNRTTNDDDAYFVRGESMYRSVGMFVKARQKNFDLSFDEKRELFVHLNLIRIDRQDYK